MGEILQVRVSVETFTIEAARKRWPVLFGLADPDNTIQELPILVDRLHDVLRFGDISQEHKHTLEAGMEAILNALHELQEQLAHRQPALADKASYTLEDELDNLEKNISAL